MAHFAEIRQGTDPTGFTADKHWVVHRVVVVDNKHVPSNEHVDGETWCINFFGPLTTWKQTSYNNNFRKQYAGSGDIYDYAKNKFLNRQPYASWSLDDNDDWQAPVISPLKHDSNYPATYIINWDEAEQKWWGIKRTMTDEGKNRTIWDWDPSSLTWVFVKNKPDPIG